MARKFTPEFHEQLDQLMQGFGPYCLVVADELLTSTEGPGQALNQLMQAIPACLENMPRDERLRAAHLLQHNVNEIVTRVLLGALS